MRHGTCFHRRLSTHRAGTAPPSAVAELLSLAKTMKILPKSRGERVRFAVSAMLLVAVCGYFRLDRVAAFYLSDKREGDILFQSLPRGQLVDAIEGVTSSEWSHCGLLQKNDGGWYVAEAIGQVRYTPLYLWVVRGRGSKVASYRLKDVPVGLDQALVGGVRALLGRPYDFRYAPEDDEIYCSELVYKVYDRTLGIRIGAWERLGDLNWKPFEPVIREMENGGLPLDRMMITPVGLTRSSLVWEVF